VKIDLRTVEQLLASVPQAETLESLPPLQRKVLQRLEHWISDNSTDPDLFALLVALIQSSARSD
jgi:hypothetical protein